MISDVDLTRAAQTGDRKRVASGRRDLTAPLSGVIFERTERVAYLATIASSDKGGGHVGRLIDSLTSEFDVVVVPNVVSAILAGMLDRRGFHEETHFAPAPFNSEIPCWVYRRPLDGAA